MSDHWFRPMPALESVALLDLMELGERAAMGLWGENTGLAWSQRLPAILQRRAPRFEWRLHRGPDGKARHLSAVYAGGAW